MKITIISDTHLDYSLLDLKSADILIHCGDIDVYEQSDLWQFNNWLKKQPFKYIIVIGGNHDKYLEKQGMKSIQKSLTNAIYLENSGIEINGIKFWGSPMTPTFMNWSFMCERDKIFKYWDMIDSDTKVLITHGPPYRTLDYTSYNYSKDHNVGCEALLERVKLLKPIIHCFGHIHYCYGTFKDKNTNFINASLMNEGYALVNKPIVVEI